MRGLTTPGARMTDADADSTRSHDISWLTSITPRGRRCRSKGTSMTTWPWLANCCAKMVRVRLSACPSVVEHHDSSVHSEGGQPFHGLRSGSCALHPPRAHHDQRPPVPVD